MNKNYRLPAIVCALAVCLALCFAVAAWDGPSGNPPDSNIAAPINAGSEAQYKTGGLGVKIGGAITYWISQIGNNLVFKTGDDFATAVETVNINTDGRIGNVSAPIDDKDAVNKAYLDAQSGGGTNYGTCDGSQLFIKFTAATYNGNLGGIDGANTKCASEYEGYHFCQVSEMANFGRRGCLPIPGRYNVRAQGWIDPSPDDYHCNHWTGGSYYYNSGSLLRLFDINPVGKHFTGDWGWSQYLPCSDYSALACCKEI